MNDQTTTIRRASSWSVLKTAHAMLALPLLLGASAAAQTDRAYVKTRDGQTPKPTIAVDNVCAWPNLTVLRDGTIIATIFNQPNHGLSAGDVECWASRDGGDTWTKRGTPAPHESEDSNRMNVAAGLANNGDLLVIASGWASRDVSGKPGKPFRERIVAPWVSRSTDGGKTWTIDAKAIPAQWPEAARRPHSAEGICVPFGDILPGNDGTLRVALYSGGRGGTFVYRSTDDGRTWGDPVAISKDASSTSRPCSIWAGASGCARRAFAASTSTRPPPPLRPGPAGKH